MLDHRSSFLPSRATLWLSLLLLSAFAGCEDTLKPGDEPGGEHGNEHDEPEVDAGGGSSETGSDARINRAPMLGTYRVTTPEDVPLDTQLPAEDPDGDKLDYTLLDEPDHGALQFDAVTGHVIYTPASNYAGEDSFTFRVSDGDLSSAIGTVIISVTAVNDAPIAADQRIETPEDSAVEVELAGSDPDGDTLEFSVVDAPEHGTFVARGGTKFLYTPAANYAGEDRVRFKVSDGPLASALATVTLVVSAVADSPIANDDRISVSEGGTATSLIGGATSVLANDNDVEKEVLVVATLPVTAPAHGTLVLSADGHFMYTHDGSETTSDAFAYRVCEADTAAACDEATVKITVTAYNDSPIAVADGAAVREGSKTNALDGDVESVLANDSDPEGNTLRVRRAPLVNVKHGSLDLQADGRFNYVHDSSETTEDSFTYEVCDNGSPSRCSSAVVTFAVEPVNDAPIAGDDAIVVTEGAIATRLAGGANSALINDGDAEGALVVDSTPYVGVSFGTLTLAADGTFTYAHDGSDTTSDQFVYRVCDMDAEPICVFATVAITITPVNDPPVAQDDALFVLEGQSQTELSEGGASFLSNDSDAEGDAFAVSDAPLVAPEHGTLTLNADGTFNYQHDGSETTADSFVYEVCDDGSPTECSAATVFVTIEEVNDAPLAVADAIEVDEGGTATELEDGDDSLLDNDSDGEGETIAVNTTPIANVSHGALILNADGTFSYEHDGSETNEDEFTYEVCDTRGGCTQASVEITIIPVNDPPIAVADTLSVEEGSVETILSTDDDSVLDNDSDADSLVLVVDPTPVVAPARGVLVLNPDGTFTYTHDGSETTSDSFTYEVCDDGTPQACSETTVEVFILPVNDAPVATGDAIEANEGGTTNTLASGGLNLLSNDTDAENNPLNVSVAPLVAPEHGTVTLNPDGTFSYTHDGSETTSDTFVYEVCDNGNPSQCGSASADIDITLVDDAPVAVADAITVNEGATATQLTGGATSVLANDSDAEGDSLVVSTSPVSGVSNGILALNADGTFSYAHNGSESMQDSFTYQLCAGSSCSTALVTITITPVNDAPVAMPDEFTASEGGTIGQGLDLLENDVDPEDGVLTVNVVPVEDPSHGTVTLNADGTFEYQHDGSETTSDEFTYEVCDNGTPAECAAGVVTLTITIENDEPVANPDEITVDEGGTVSTLDGGANSVTQNDVDEEGQTLTVNTTPVSNVLHGTLTLDPDGTFEYVHDGSEFTTDEFSYEVCDVGPPPACATGTVTITITPVNEPPVAGADALTVAEGQSTSTLTGGATSLLANDTDPDSTQLTVTNLSGLPQRGSVAVNPDGTFTYTHSGAEFFTDSFGYQVCDDGTPVECVTGTVTVTITPINDAPTAGADLIAVEEGGTATTLLDGEASLLFDDVDPEGGAIAPTVTEEPSNGTLTVNTDGTFSYTHDGGETTEDSFTYVACETASSGLCSSDATVTISVDPVNDAPAAGSYVYSAEQNEVLVVTASDVTLGSKDTDAEGGTLAITAFTATSALGGTVNVNTSTGTFTYLSPLNQGGQDSFTYTVTDNGSPAASTVVTVTVLVTTNSPPALSGGPFVITTLPRQNGDVVGTISVTDDQVGQTHTFEITAGNDLGYFAVDPSTGAISIADASSAEGGIYTLTVKATDNGVPPLSDELEVVVTLVDEPGPVNDGPYTVLSTALSQFDLTTNDALGTPGAKVTSFGGGSLGGSVTDNPTGSTPVALAGGSITLDDEGDLEVQLVTPGTYTFEYRLDNGIQREGSVTIVVCLNLQVGDVYLAKPEEQPTVCLGSAAQSRYTFVPMNLNPDADYALTVTPSGVTTPSGKAPSAGPEPLTDTHAAFRKTQHDEVASRAGTTSTGKAVSAGIVSGTPSVDDVWSLNVDVTTPCESGSAQAATVEFVGEHSIVVVDNSVPDGGFDADQLRAYAWNFDNVIYPTLVGWYGEPGDIDGNDRVVLFFTPAMNRLSAAGEPAHISRAMTRDLLDQTECPASNVGEIIYILTPDPDGTINSNVRTRSFAFTQFELVHELGHLIVDATRLAIDGPFEESWLDEGLANIANELVFYDGPIGYAFPNQPSGATIPGTTNEAAAMEHFANITLSYLTVGPFMGARTGAFNNYLSPLNFTQLRAFMQAPSRAGLADSITGAVSQRGAAWAFLRYAADRYAEGSLIAEQSFWMSLIESETMGMKNLQAALEEDPLPWLRDFLISLYVDDNFATPNLDVPGLPYQTESWNYRSVYSGLPSGFLLQVAEFVPDIDATFMLGKGGASSYVEFGVPANTIGTLTLTPPGGPPSDAWYAIFRTDVQQN